MDEKAGADRSFSFTTFGKRGRDWCRKKKLLISDEHIGIVGSKIGFNIAAVSGRKLVDGFLSGEYDEVYVVYSQFVSMSRQVPVVQQLLPIPPIVSAAGPVERDE